MMSSKRFLQCDLFKHRFTTGCLLFTKGCKNPKANASVFIHVLDTSCDYLYTVNHSLQKEHENKVSQNILARIVN